MSRHHPSFLKKNMDWAMGRQGKNEVGRQYAKTHYDLTRRHSNNVLM